MAPICCSKFVAPVYNGTLDAGFGHRFDRISEADLAVATAA
jgi:hypothetical protein